MEQVNKLKEKLKNKNLKGLALDIDETLADSNKYWFESMFEFHRPEGLDVEKIMRENRFVEDVPGWNTKEAFEHMEKLLHSEGFNESIPLIEDSNHVVNKINKKIPIVAYITARPETILDATKRWLDRHGFPKADLIMRPADTKASATDLADRNKWKAEILVKLYPNVLGIIDDNKVLAHELDKLKYKGTLYLYGPESDEFDGYKHVVVCSTWDSVAKRLL